MTEPLFFIILPAAFSLCLRFFLLRILFPDAGFRESIIYLFLWTSVLCWLYAEGASLWNLTGYASARFYWVGISLFELLLFFLKGRGGRMHPPRTLLPNPPIQALRSFYKDFRLFAIASALVIVPLFLLAVGTPPNNFDSNSYHLHRILAWIHYGNINFFPTPHIQQLYHNVFAEYLILNVYLVSGSDRLVSLVQYFAGLGCIATLTLVAGQLGLNRKGQVLAAFVLLTLPIGIFELTTTQVDYVACFFFISFLYFGYKLLDTYSLPSVLALSLSLSFAAFTKYPVLFYALPFCLYFGISYLRKYRIQRSFVILLIALVSLATVFQPFWKRNYELFGHVLSPPKDSPFFAEKLQADDVNFVFTLSNVIKNSSLHLGLPYSGFNQLIEGGIKRTHEALHVNINQPEISEDAFSVRFSVHEDMVPNSLHFYLILFATLWLCFLKGERRLKVFWLAGVVGFVIFCALLKFQLWSTRTHMPFFVMGSVLIGFFLQKMPVVVRGLVLVSLYIPALFFVFGNPSKPVLQLPYLAKKVTAHIPSTICLDSEEKEMRYQKELLDHYQPKQHAMGCYDLVGFPGFKERRQVFEKLNDLGYYDEIKKNIFSMSRAELYFLNDREKFQKFWPLLDRVEGNHPGVAVMSRNDDGFYFYQRALRAKKNIEADFNYAFYKKEFTTLENAKRDFCYDYILTDELDLVTEHLGNKIIDQVHSGGGGLLLIRLKDRTCGSFVY